MHKPIVKHTLFIFERLFQTMPPLVPDAIVEDVRAALEQARHNYTLSVIDLEDIVLAFGKKLWPYRKAFDEFYDIYEGELGESFLLSRMSAGLKKRYKEFLVYGGSFRDLHRGRPAEFFAQDERRELCSLLIQTRDDVLKHTRQAVTSTEQRRYEARIIEFHSILEDIEKRLDTLLTMAEDEQEHPELSSEIRAQVKGFEQGLCLLGPHTGHDDVCNAIPHFEGRKEEKKMKIHK